MSMACSSGVRSLCQSLKIIGRMSSRGSFSALLDLSGQQFSTAANALKEEHYHTDSTHEKSNQVVSQTNTLKNKNKPEAPLFCCMSGCANCVWIEYASELTSFYKDGGKAALEEIEKLEDPSLKMILKMQLDLS